MINVEPPFLSLWHWSLYVRSCHVTSRRVMSHHDISCHVMCACTESSFLGFGPGAGVREVQNGSFLKAALVQNRHFWALVRVRAFERLG